MAELFDPKFSLYNKVSLKGTDMSFRVVLKPLNLGTIPDTSSSVQNVFFPRSTMK